jgi:1-deoxy-D-xylulose-5-phosphate synthase
MRFIKPLDDELLARVTAAADRLVCLEDHAVTGGFGSAVLEWLAHRPSVQPQVLQVGVPDKFIEHGSMQQLFESLELDAAAVARRVAAFMKS